MTATIAEFYAVMFWVMQIYISLTSRGYMRCATVGYIVPLRPGLLFTPCSIAEHVSHPPKKTGEPSSGIDVLFTKADLATQAKKKSPGIYMVRGTKPSGNCRNSLPKPGTLKYDCCDARTHV